ncbi:MAG: peptide-methionine (S)-S-oxide reductase MsrA [Bacteroidales bacterium]|nr:peptide-methionine (S)-S-oxide reductase MsrA [Bacteroidales bacterium]
MEEAMKYFVAIIMLTATMSIGAGEGLTQNDQISEVMENKSMEDERMKTATLGAGCFWCVEAIFQKLKGVKKVTSGYAGGQIKNPSYKEVTRGNTGHAESVQIQYDPDEIGFEKILEVFWKTHDPTTLNRQGADIGPQYRSVIFYHDQEQKRIAEESKKKMDRSGTFNDPIVTAIEPYKNFYVAEDYHQDFYKNNPNQPYCRFNIDPKMEKMQQQFGRYLK